MVALFASNLTLDDRGGKPPTIQRCNHLMLEINFQQRAVLKALLSLDIYKSSGPDLISPIVLRTLFSILSPVLAPELAPVQTRIFQHFFYSLGVVPKFWKTALVHPITKKGERSDHNQGLSHVQQKQVTPYKEVFQYLYNYSAKSFKEYHSYKEMLTAI